MKLPLLCLSCLFFFIRLLAQKDCRQEYYQQQLLQLHPSLHAQYEKVEAFTRTYSAVFRAGSRGDTVSGPAVSVVPEKIVIPVVVHIIWNNASQNISNAQVFS